MTLRPRAASLLLALALPAALLVGCGNEEAPEPEAYLLTDLEGGTAAPDALGSAAPTTDASEPAVEVSTGEELIAQIGAAVGELDSVRITRGTGTPPADIDAVVTYGDTADFEATLYLGPGTPEMLVSRVDDILYVGDPDNPQQPVSSDDVRPGAGGSLPSLFAWSPLLDLRAVLQSAGAVSAAGPTEIDGDPVTSYRFSTDLDALPQPSVIVPEPESGSASATLSLDADSLPVRLKISYDGALGATTVVLTYADWGATVDISVPAAG